MQPDRFPMFDSLRAVAALCVVGFHGVYQVAGNAQVGEAWWRYGRNLDVGVPIFFAISGFLLYRPFVAARQAGRPLPSLRRYAVRRALRIVPAFWVALVVVTIWFDLPDTRSLEGIVRYFGFLQVYDSDTAVRMIGQAWSLDVEVVFYLALPLWALWGLRSGVPGLVALIAASVAWKLFAVSQADPAQAGDVAWFLVFPAWVDHLAIGMLLAVLSVRGGVPRVLGRPRVMWAAALLLFVAAAWVLQPGPRESATDTSYLVRHLLFGGLIFCLLAPAVFGSLRPTRLLTWIGTVSYSLYLIHFAAIAQLSLWWDDVPRGAGWIAWAAAVLGGSLLLAAVGYQLVERPFIRLGRFRRTAQEHAAP